MGGKPVVTPSAPIAGSLRIQTSLQGRAIPLIYGRTRIASNVVQFVDFTAITTTSTQGGKGGGGVSSSSTTYSATILLAICAGPIAQIYRIWVADKLYNDRIVQIPAVVDSNGVVVTPARTVVENALSQLGFTLYDGSPGQQIPGYMLSNHPDKAVAYPFVGYVMGINYPLGSSPQIANHTFEVQGLAGFSDTIPDAPPFCVLLDLYANPLYGALTGVPISSEGTDATDFVNYTNAAGLFISPAYTDQDTLANITDRIMQISNSAIVFSGGVFKFRPYGDEAISGNGYTYTPNLVPVYALTDDDFLSDGQNDPVQIQRSNPADAFNRVTVKYYNRKHHYNEALATAEDLANIELFGLREMPVIELYEICDPQVARNVAQLILQRGLYIRNTYTFSLPWNFCLLEPMDIVTLTEFTGTGLNNAPVRITEVEEDTDGTLKFTAEDFPGTVSSHVAYPVPIAEGTAVDFNADPGDATAVIFEAPDLLTATGFEVWVGAAGGVNWGGADVYVSTDDVNYKKLGTLNAPLRMGAVTADLPNSANDPDQTNTLAVSLILPDFTLNGGSQADVDAFNTLCLVGTEFIAYRDATLTAPGTYDLDYLRRGVYNSVPANHPTGTPFARIDQNLVFKYPFTADRIGNYIYVKLVSFNRYGAAYQDLANVTAIPYKIFGFALQSPLPDVANLRTNYVSNMATLYWDSVQDFRQANIDYEIRYGDTFASAVVLGRTTGNSFTTIGDGTYWVAAHFNTSGTNIYSQNAADVLIAGSVLTQNVIASYDEEATGWTGSLTTGFVIDGTELALSASGDILSEANVLTVADIISYGGLTMSGTYTLPVGHIVALAAEAACPVLINFKARGDALHANFLDVTDVFAQPDILGSEYAAFITVRPQIAVAPASGIYGAWQDYAPGVYFGQYFKARVTIETADPKVIGFLSDFVFSVDVPDKTFTGNLTTAAGGTTVTYPTPFNVAANPQITIVGATAGDDVILSAVSVNGFTVQVKNGGSGVARSINYFVQSY